MGIRGSLRFFLVCLVLFSAVSAQNKTETSSNLREGWRPEPSGPGTWSILWSCVSLLYVYLWSVMRPDVEDLTERRAWRWRIYLVLSSLLAPEFLCYLAVAEFVPAYAWQKWLKSLRGVEGAKDWTLAHWFLCDMGAVHRIVAPTGPLSESANELRSKSHVCKPPDSLRFCMRDVHTYIERHNRVPFDVSAAHIQGWNKSDNLVIFLAILQTTWMATQCLVRSIKGLDISLLELVTVAYTPLTFATFMLWFKKPLLDVAQIYLPPEEKPFEDGLPRTIPPAPKLMGGQGCILLGAFLPGVVFCVIHLAAWNYDFPTRAESILWRTFSSLALTAGVLCGVLYLYILYEEKFVDTIILKMLVTIIERLFPSGLVVNVSLMILYAICRAILLVLAFTSLRSLPSSVYQTVHWTQAIPHVF